MEIYKPGMAFVGRILQLSPIPEADFIQRAEVVCGKGGKWSGVVRKEVNEGDKVIVFLPDSVIPSTHPELDFMEKYHWRVRPMRLRGCPSEVLIMPADVMKIEGEIGMDVTDLLGVMKYEKEIPVSLSGIMAGAFPIFIPKTDEPNFQTVPELREALIGQECSITTKYDGSSQTFYHRDGYFGGCSRNWELNDTPIAAVWAIARKFNLMEELPKFGNIALQWEIVGPGIQGNPLKFTKVEPRLFDIWDIDNQQYLGRDTLVEFAELIGIPYVIGMRIIYQDFTDDELRKMAEGLYRELGKQREGIVIRSVKEMRVEGERLSFKVINLLYKEK